MNNDDRIREIEEQLRRGRAAGLVMGDSEKDLVFLLTRLRALECDRDTEILARRTAESRCARIEADVGEAVAHLDWLCKWWPRDRTYNGFKMAIAFLDRVRGTIFKTGASAP